MNSISSSFNHNGNMSSSHMSHSGRFAHHQNSGGSSSSRQLSYSQRNTSIINNNNNNNNADPDASQHSNGTNGVNTTSTTTNTTNNMNKPRLLFHCCCGYMVQFPSWINEGCCFPLSHYVLSSLLWRTSLVLGNLILLFGSPIHMLWLPKILDPAMDVLYTLVLIVFIVDMVFRAIVMPGYFGFSVSRIYQQQKRPRTSWGRWIRMGSFLFWCDLLSTLTLLFEISYINPRRYEMYTLEYELNHVGLPDMSGDPSLNIFSQRGETSGSLMVTILKTARIVRFVRSSAVSTLISKVNWYWPQQKASAVGNAIKCCNTHVEEDDPDASEHPTGSGGGGGGGTGKPSSTKPNKSTNISAAEEFQNARRSSWGGLGLATLAAVKAKRLAAEAEEEQNKGVLGVIKKMLRSVGLMPMENTEWQRHMAASKIQRAWRKAVAKHIAMENSEHFHDETAGSGLLLKNSVGTSMGPNSWKASSLNKKETPSKKKLLPASLRKLSANPRISGGVVDANGLPPTANNPNKKVGKPIADGLAESQVGGAMRELTGQRVAIGILVALLLTAMFTYVEKDSTRPATMIILHRQTTGTKVTPNGSWTVLKPPPQEFNDIALMAARNSSVPDLYRFEFADGSTISENLMALSSDEGDLRDREKLRIEVKSTNYSSPLPYTKISSVGYFEYREARRAQALVQLFSTIFILLLWLFGVTAFAGPVMVLVVLPIERMVRLLGMLMLDPLGYQSTSRYRRFVAEEDQLTKNTRWTKEVLKGMETSFLMSTILRIGSLMKVGFGSAGVEIIRKNLEKKQGGKVNLLTSKGLTVSCIFLFCDIRQFTDATECLQEEVFVFTNRIAAVVHSFCHSYGGSANKNVGDAFLCSWLLDDPPNDGGFGGGDKLYAKNNQADKCLLCVVKVLMALHHDNYYIETMSEAARQRLLAKLKKRPGPVVQMGCGLHAGKAVQGAIGSERKIDATYVSEAVEMSEFLESSTKKYGLKMLMSNSFHNLLHANNRQRCRLVDQIVLPNDEDEDEDDPAIIYERDDIVELYTYDMEIEALWNAPPVQAGMGPSTNEKSGLVEAGNTSDGDSQQGLSSRRVVDFHKGGLSQRNIPAGSMRRGGRRLSLAMLTSKTNVTSSNSSSTKIPENVMEEFVTDHNSAALNLKTSGTVSHGPSLGNSETIPEHGRPKDQEFRKPELVLPTGPSLYNPTIWRSEAMFRIRKKYLDGLFFHNYSQGLQSFYARDWDRAKQMFTSILEGFEDGPSRYFLNQINNHGGKPPPNFKPYGLP